MSKIYYIGSTGIQELPNVAATNNAHANTDMGLYNQVVAMEKILRNAGIPDNMLNYAIAQIMLESADFSSNLAANYNNYSGIRYVHQSNANGSQNGFATYSSPDHWAADYKRVLSLSPGRPIDSSSAQDFYLRLQKNNYFVPSEANQYATGFNSKIKKLAQVLNDASDLGAQYASGKKNTYTTSSSMKKGASAAENTKFDAERDFNKVKLWAKDHPTEAIGVGIIAAIVLTKAFS